MALTEQLAKKRTALGEKSAKKLEESGPKTASAEIDSSEWLIMFLLFGYIDILFILLFIFGLVPFIGQVVYTIVDPILNFIAMGILNLWLYNKGLLARRWMISTSSGFIGMIPIANWFSWIGMILVLYVLNEAERFSSVAQQTLKIQQAVKVAEKVITKIK